MTGESSERTTKSEPTGAWQPPEAVEGPVAGITFASPGSRLVAYVVDLAVQFVLILLLGGVTLILGAIFLPLVILGAMAVTALWIGYFPYFWAKNGQTPGMSAMKIKIVRDADGGPITSGAAILRFIGLWIALSVFWIGVIWIFIDKRKRGWQDLIGGTVVVDAPPTTYTS